MHSTAKAATLPATASPADGAQLRNEIAVVTRLLNMLDIMEYSGHVSARLPGQGSFLIQDVEISRAAVRPSDLLACDLAGKAGRAHDRQRPPSEIFIHSEIYKARPDVGAIAHFHHDLATLFTIVKGRPVAPVKNHAVRWRSGIPVHRNPAHVDSPDLGRELAGTLGQSNAVFLRAHGQVVVAESLAALLVDCVHLIENCSALFQAAQLGAELDPLTEEEMDAFSATFNRARHVRKLWTYYVGLGRERNLLDDLEI